jgi:hypothetical protein
VTIGLGRILGSDAGEGSHRNDLRDCEEIPESGQALATTRMNEDDDLVVSPGPLHRHGGRGTTHVGRWFRVKLRERRERGRRHSAVAIRDEREAPAPPEIRDHYEQNQRDVEDEQSRT